MHMSEEILKDLFIQDFSHFIVQIFGVWLHKALADYICIVAQISNVSNCSKMIHLLHNALYIWTENIDLDQQCSLKSLERFFIEKSSEKIAQNWCFPFLKKDICSIRIEFFCHHFPSIDIERRNNKTFLPIATARQLCKTKIELCWRRTINVFLGDIIQVFEAASCNLI